VIVTGIAPTPQALHERAYYPSGELINLAKNSLHFYGATHLITSLSWGWERALVKAAVELEIPFTVAIPYPEREIEWKPEARRGYQEMLSKAQDLQLVSERLTPTAVTESLFWRANRADLVLALWEYDFEGMTYEVMRYAWSEGKMVVNLWEEWQRLFSLRRQRRLSYVSCERSGAQVFGE
jgi:hypothetical protein